MKRLGKDVSSVDVANAGHVVMVDQPEAFIEATRGFVGL
jgi:pimeloyl-ACP methyl ester carboxylesterase